MTCAIKLTVDGPLPLLLSGYIQESATVWRLHCYDFGVFGRSQRAVGVVELIVIPVGPMREGSRIIKTSAAAPNQARNSTFALRHRRLQPLSRAIRGCAHRISHGAAGCVLYITLCETSCLCSARGLPAKKGDEKTAPSIVMILSVQSPIFTSFLKKIMSLS
jgi:hypothetical protein